MYYLWYILLSVPVAVEQEEGVFEHVFAEEETHLPQNEGVVFSEGLVVGEDEYEGMQSPRQTVHHLTHRAQTLLGVCLEVEQSRGVDDAQGPTARTSELHLNTTRQLSFFSIK